MEDSNEEQDEVEQHMKDISEEPNVVEEHREERRETMWSGTRRKATSLSSLTIFSERLAPTFNTRESIHRFQDYMSQYYYQVVKDFKSYLRKFTHGYWVSQTRVPGSESPRHVSDVLLQGI